jgi:hypothetical protein
VDWKKLADRAKQVVDQRGGSGSVKEDAQEVKSIFQGEGTLADKAKRAAAAIKEPGAGGSAASSGAGESAASSGAGASAASSGAAAEEETASVAGTDSAEPVESDEEGR